jgi:uncharacterized membrane protein (UPF0127 family)
MWYVVLLILLLAVLTAAVRERPLFPRATERATVTFETGSSVSALVARREDEQHRGLSGLPGLGSGEGMLFVYSDLRERHFWMKDMRFAIDIVWIRRSAEGVGGVEEGETATIIGVSSRVPPPPSRRSPPARRSSPEPVDLVLELPEGTAEALGAREGGKIFIAFSL